MNYVYWLGIVFYSGQRRQRNATPVTTVSSCSTPQTIIIALSLNISLLLLHLGQSCINHWRLAGDPRFQVQEKNRYGSPREPRHDTRVDNVAIRIGQALDGRHDSSHADTDTPRDNLALFGGVNEAHAVKGSHREMVPTSAVLTWNQGKGAGHHQGRELGLKALVAFHVSEP